MPRLKNPGLKTQREDGSSSAKRCEPAAPERAQKEASAAILHCRPFVLWQVSGYSLLIQAVDSGIPAMSSTATVNIDISDVNDNSPVFTPANYTAVIQVSTSGLPGSCPYALILLPPLLVTHHGLLLFLPNINSSHHRASMKRA